jgi:YD repeat-containing protein
MTRNVIASSRHPSRTLRVVLVLAPALLACVAGLSRADVPVLYSHDAANRLIQAVSATGSGVGLQYDANGNLTGFGSFAPPVLNPGTAQTVQITAPGGNAVFGFSSSGTGSSMSLAIGSVATTPAGTPVQVSVYDSSGTLVTSATSTGATSLSLPTLAAGNYTVIVSPENGATGSLQVTLQSTSGSTGNFVQANYNQHECLNCVALAYPLAQTVGNLNVVIVSWGDSTSTVTGVTDTAGNTYSLAVGPTVLAGNLSQSIYYSRNLFASGAGANHVIVSFNALPSTPDVRIAEYSGITSRSPLDVAIGNSGTSALSTSGALTTTNAFDLLIAANDVEDLTTGAGTGFTQRLKTPTFGDILEDQVVTSAGSYTATAPLASSAPWIMQVAAFKGASGSSIDFVQANYNQSACNHCIVTTYPKAQTAGNLNLVVVSWGDSTTTVSSVTDTLGNTYSLAAGPTTVAGELTQAIYYTRNIANAIAGANHVTVTFNGVATGPDIRIAEYSGIAQRNPLDASASNTGSTATSSAGPLTTTNAHDLLIAANDVEASTTGPGSGYTQRLSTPTYGDFLEDQTVTAIGSYAASAPLSGSAPWIMQVVAFKLAN